MKVRRLIILSIVLLLAACAPAGPRAAELLPTVDTAQIVEGKLADYMRSSKVGVVTLGAHPAETDLIDVIDQAWACYQQIDGVATQAYSDKRLPLMLGVVFIADLTSSDRAALDRCFAMGQQTIAGKPTYERCAQAYTTTVGAKEFYAAYLALAPNMCTILCAHLPSCTAP
jgi:hypothetical protein